MKFLDPKLSFKPDRPFYGIICGYLAQVHGFIELLSRGLKDKFDSLTPEEYNQLIDYLDKPECRKRVKAIAEGGKTGLLGCQSLGSNTGDNIKIYSEILASEICMNHEEALKHFNRMSAGGLLILAWELTHNYHTQHELWEFFRHCRNAAAHNGKFTFHKGQLKYPARWKSLEIIQALDGYTLFVDPPAPGFMGIGDVLYLLYDVESTFLL